MRIEANEGERDRLADDLSAGIAGAAREVQHIAKADGNKCLQDIGEYIERKAWRLFKAFLPEEWAGVKSWFEGMAAETRTLRAVVTCENCRHRLNCLICGGQQGQDPATWFCADGEEDER